MSKLIKFFIFLEFLLLLFIVAQWFFLDLPSAILYASISVFVGILSLIFFFAFILLLKHIFRSRSSKKSPKIGLFAFVFGIVLLVVVTVLAFNYSLYFQALLGNDLFLTLNLNQDNFEVKNGETFSIEAHSAIITNPFCSANCNLTLVDLTNQEVLFYEDLQIYVSNPSTKNYNVVVDESRFGQKFYRVDLRCTSQTSLFCYTTTNNTKHVSKIAFVQHSLNDEQNKSFNLIGKEISLLNSRYNSLVLNLNSLNVLIKENNSLDLSAFDSRVSSSIEKTKAINLEDIIQDYSRQELSSIQKDMANKARSISKLEYEFNEINESVLLEINQYNTFANNVRVFETSLADVSFSSWDNSSVLLLDDLILKFNNYLNLFSRYGNITYKESIYQNISSLVNGFDFSVLSSGDFPTNFSVLNISLENLSISYPNANTTFNISSSPVCCAFGECSACFMKNSSMDYPVILLHGHSFNEKVSAVASLEVFNSLQEKLENDGYFNAGSFFYAGYEDYSYRTFGGINVPISIKASYYFDVFSSDSGVSLLETKTDNIDTYSIRLKEIIDNVKYITGKDKVILVTHSMGGLVARRYLQVFGSENVERLIMVAAPNYGVDGFVVDYCTIFGTEDECNDMNSDSLFLNKLSKQTSLDIPVYNIIGEGCSWENSNGDGIVKVDSAYLPFAKNYYVNGSCSGFNYFHSEILNVWKYPEVYDLVKKSLEEN